MADAGSLDRPTAGRTTRICIDAYACASPLCGGDGHTLSVEVNP
jgi:hypothetical protein